MPNPFGTARTGNPTSALSLARRRGRSARALATAWAALLSVAALAQDEQPTLVVGKVFWPGHDLAKARVELFTDAAWRDRAATSSRVGEQGTYAVVVKPGRYFARLWVDDNGNGKLDTNDGIGFYGIASPAELRVPPKAIEVQRGQVRTDVEIAVVGTIGADGTPQPLGPEGEAAANIIVTGKVLWPDHPVGGASVDLFRDGKFRDLVQSSPPAEEGGSFAVVVAPGTYYVRVVVDANANGRLDAGDGIGFYGVDDMADPDQKPLPFVVDPDEFALHIRVPVSAVVGEEGGLKAIQTPATLGGPPEAAHGTMRGRLAWQGHTFEQAWVLCASPRSWLTGAAAARPDPATGEFEVRAPAGERVLLAIVDADGNGRIDTGDAVGVLGMGGFSDASARPTVIELKKDATVEGLELAIRGRVIDGGSIVPLEGEVPENLPDVNVEGSGMPAMIEGRIVWPGAPEPPNGGPAWPWRAGASRVGDGAAPHGSVNVFRDPAFLDHAATVQCDPATGRFVLALPEGDYYLMAGVDADGDGRVSPGDGIGMYGTDDILKSKQKQTLHVANGTFVTGIEIVVSATFNANLVPEPAANRPP